MLLPPIIPFDTLPIAAFVVDADGTIASINAAACLAIATPAETLVGRRIGELVPALQPQWARLVGSVRANGQLAEELVIEMRVVQIIATALDDRILCFAIDVTGPRAAARAGVEDASRQRLESIGLVAGGIAHDFNNLLVGVLAEASAAREDRALSDQTKETLRRIEMAATRMAQLTRQLLAYAGRGRFVTVLVDPELLLGDLTEQLARIVRSDAVLAVTPRAGSVALEADPDLFHQVVVALVANAADAIAAGGHISLTSSLVFDDDIPWWQLEVVDDGAGIDPTSLGKIFDPFFTTKPDRHGLGLSAVHGIVRRLGGDIEVTSTLGHGSRFRVRLPTLPGAKPPQRRPSSVVMPTLQLAGLQVLIADDEPSVRSTVRRLLERRGATVTLAADGAEAEARLRERRFDLVILDVSMPGRSGYEVLPVARATQSGVPVVLMSGYTEHDHGTDEPDAFLEKPFTAKVLDAAIDEVLGGVTRR